jgi:hypothetical protein
MTSCASGTASRIVSLTVLSVRFTSLGKDAMYSSTVLKSVLAIPDSLRATPGSYAAVRDRIGFTLHRM